jgi:ATP-dependent Lon protease
MGWFGKRKSFTPDETGPAPAETHGLRPTPPPAAAHDSLREQVESAGLPPEIQDTARAECERMDNLDPASPEYAISLNFLEVILSLPWNTATRDNLDITRAEEVLGARHYGLQRVKDRILEFLAVKSLCSRRNPRVLLVDDELIARENLTIVFETDGYEVEAVGNGLEAVAAMEREPANIVVSDLKMEGMDGMELLQVLRKRWPDTKVVMITGYATVKTAVDAMRRGADQYLGKPVNLTKLRQLVAELWEQSLRAQHLRGFVLCFTGPPGMGKTSIGKAIAEALGRKFMRLSLAGLRDEAELRGHRRTYVGAMPGRIIQGIRKVGTRNPVIMLDEVDKAVQDFQGDATSVLLEMLDAEQNTAFVDHYLGLPFDLSAALFICTANGVERLPAPLRDRLEVIEFPSYTPREKLQIATRYLIPEVMAQHGLDDKLLTIPDETVAALIKGYARESGLRKLRQQVASLCRKLAKRVLSEGLGKVLVDEALLQELLGAPPYTSTPAQTRPKVGLATSLVWTEIGGEIIFIEAARMRGSKQLILTGSLGEVLRESAQTALSFCRSRAETFGIDPEFYAGSDIHVHIPAGAVSKEGPSAGVAITIALLSLLTGRPVRQDVASTGELSLLGEVLPVGGIREKLMAARSAGIPVVILPQGCEASVRSVEDEVVEGLDIRYVSTMEEAAEFALCEAERAAGEDAIPGCSA